MKSHVLIRATFKHADDLQFRFLKEVVLTTMREAFQDDLAVTGDIIVKTWAQQAEQRSFTIQDMKTAWTDGWLHGGKTRDNQSRFRQAEYFKDTFGININDL